MGFVDGGKEQSTYINHFGASAESPFPASTCLKSWRATCGNSALPYKYEQKLRWPEQVEVKERSKIIGTPKTFPSDVMIRRVGHRSQVTDYAHARNRRLLLVRDD